MEMNRDFARREIVTVVPSVDGVLGGNIPGAIDRLDQTFQFRVFTNGDNDRAHALLAAQLAPGLPQRLVYQTDAGTLWYANAYNPSIRHSLTSGNQWGNVGFVDFTVTWRRTPWTPRFSQNADIWGYNDGIWGINDGLWGVNQYAVLNSTATYINVDATGTAGVDLPTIPTTDAHMTVNGSFGGDGQPIATDGSQVSIAIINYSNMVVTPSGAIDAGYLWLPPPALGFGSYFDLDFASQTFLRVDPNGVIAPFRPKKPSYQPFYFQIEPGMQNAVGVFGIGLNNTARVNGTISLDWFKYFA
jgi:hypothetical protein